MKIIEYDLSNQFEIENLVREAFWNIYRPGCDEHYLVHKLFNDPCYVHKLNYVCIKNNKIVGAIFYSLASVIDNNGNRHPILNLGPIAVDPLYQNQGIGSNLINHTLQTAKKLGYQAVVLCGDPHYYHKFGFISASTVKVYYEGMDKNDEADFFMINILDNSFDLQGTYYEAECYVTIDQNEVEEFDKQFPKKEKLILDSQIFK